jgi:NAD-dependent dihydropyrimidine dehydrogenase PreA subunit
MIKYTHGFEINQKQCNGKLACMRACPTHAIRVRGGKATVQPELCIDCGICFTVCPSGAIQPITLSFADITKFKYKVAVPSPVLFGQFSMSGSIEPIVKGLLGIGFDAVWNYSVDLALVNRGISEYLKSGNGPRPLISITCPVVVRLVQVLYPGIVGHLIPVQPPRELAGRALKRKYSKDLGIDSKDIAAIYITPCQAKTISILEPAEETESNLDGTIGISDVYNHIQKKINALEKEGDRADPDGINLDTSILQWARNDRQGCYLSQDRYMLVTGLPYVMQVFNDLEKGRLRNIEYLECYSCWDGCVGGNLTVENIYAARSKISRLSASLPDSDPEIEAEVERRFPHEDFALRGWIKPRPLETNISDLKDRIRRMNIESAKRMILPGLDCGLCGAPDCDSFAKDCAADRAKQYDCVFYSDESMRKLRKVYLR